MRISATYSPEDNKIRLYPSTRLDEETFQRVKAAGFIWAPKQELFVAPKWSPSREDLAIELAGEIEPEEMTLAERAQAKAERLDALAEKRLRDSNAFQRAAQDLSERFAFGQPILIGHHSERKARKDKERMEGAMRKAKSAHDAAGYWLYRAEGVERHANYKNNPRVRASRIKALLSDLRGMQRDINNAQAALLIWEKMTSGEHIRFALGRMPADRTCAAYDTYSAVDRGEKTPAEGRAECIARAEAIIRSPRLRRYIEHTLNRLGYERDLLGRVPRYDGKLTAVILQAFAREHGAEKPAGKDIDGETFILESPVPFPLHIGSGTLLEMTADEWRDLMQSAGYEVPAQKEGPPPILNFRVPMLAARSKWQRGAIDVFEQIEMTKEQYGKLHSEYRGTRESLCGEYRFRIAPKPGKPAYSSQWVAVFLVDQKEHPAPATYSEAEARKHGEEWGVK